MFIASAFAACPVDDTVIAADTTYAGEECVVGDTSSDGVIQIGADDITLDCAGLVLVGSYQGYGIVNNGFDNVTIRNCNIGAYDVAINLQNSSDDANISDNNLHSSNTGLRIHSCMDANIQDNNIGANKYGLYFYNDSNRMHISDNNIRDNNENGIVIRDSGDGNIFRNDIRGNGADLNTGGGIFTRFTTGDLNIQDNNFVDNLRNGMYLAGGRNWIEDNNIQRNRSGLVLGGAYCSDNNIRQNLIAYSSNGIYLNSPKNLLTDNNVRNNLTGILAIAETSYDNNIHRNNLDSNNRYAFYFSLDANQNTLSDNNISDNNTAGILGDTAGDSNIFRNHICFNGRAGTYQSGIYLLNVCGDMNIQDNNLCSNNPNGLYSESGRHIIQDNNISANYSYGAVLDGLMAEKLLIKDNNLTRNTLHGLYIKGFANDINILDNNISSNSNTGVYLEGSHDLNFHDNNISYNSTYGVYGKGGNRDINFTHCYANSNGTNDIYLWDSNVVFIDGNFLTTGYRDINANLNRKFFVDVNVVNQATNRGFSGATVSVIDTSGRVETAPTTHPDGNTGIFTVSHFDENTLGRLYNTTHDFTVSCGNDCDTNTVQSVVDQNRSLKIYVAPSAKITVSNPIGGQIVPTPAINFTYSITSALNPITHYWIKLDTASTWVDNGTATNYSATLSEGSHTFTIVATGLGDLNSQTTTVDFSVSFGSDAGTCGDEVCNSWESACNCADDCPPVCGDGCCTYSESVETCATDCLSICGDGFCSEDEACGSCPADCGTCPEEEPPAEPALPEENGDFPPEAPPRRDVCAEVICDDSNPCTTDFCFEGQCFYSELPDGTTCGFGMECLSGLCESLPKPFALRNASIFEEAVSILLFVLDLLGGDAIEEAPFVFFILILLAFAAAVAAYNRLRVLYPKTGLSSTRKRLMRVSLFLTALAEFLLPFLVNRLTSVEIAVAFAIIEIVSSVLIHYIYVRAAKSKNKVKV